MKADKFCPFDRGKIKFILDEYLDIRVREQSQQTRRGGDFFFWVILFGIILVFMVIPIVPNTVKGILAQFEVLISIYLTLRFARKGFWVGVTLNACNILIVIGSILFANNTNAVTGIIVSFFTIVSISIIETLMRRNLRQFMEVVRQKEELLSLNIEILSSEEKLRQQNEELIASYQVIKNDEEKLNFLAYFDTLTELPNRKMILDRLDLLVNLSQKNGLSFSVVFIDLDDFKKINDTMGHHIGDALIVAVAKRLGRRIDNGDILGRLGGDEFSLIVQRNLDDETILEYVNELRTSLDEVFKIEQQEIHINASFGISKYPQDGNIPDELIRCADTAMYKVKETGKNGIYFFHREMLDEILRKVDFENKMKEALQNEEFFLVFQPQYYIRQDGLRGFEALIRWRSPDLGILSPLKFIPVAEETRLIIPLGEWILLTACRKFKELLDLYQKDELILSVNISAIQFDDDNFVTMLESVLRESGLQAKNLELEITESVMIKSLDHTSQVLNKLKEMGVKIALDDFGTGYSSLRYLQLLPIDTLKIDKSFVDNINNDRNIHLIGAIISLVHQMDIFVVAEGVETNFQMNYLKKEDCDGVQGFFFGKPIMENELGGFLDYIASTIRDQTNETIEQ